MRLFFAISIFLSFLANSYAKDQNLGDLPSFYITPKSNDAEYLYGVAEGYTLEEATKYALVDAAARLMVSVSSESNLVREENQGSVNEEMRQKVKQNIEKINFTNFKVSESKKAQEKLYIEVKIERRSFVEEQKQQLGFLEKQVADLEKNLNGKNSIQKRNNLIKILDLQKDIEIRSRILAGLGLDVNLAAKLDRIAYFRNQFNSLSDDVEFYFADGSNQEVAKIIRSSLNKEKLKVSSRLENSNQNQIVVKIKASNKTNKIYGSFITKLEIDFSNLSNAKIIASNTLEVSGSSMISEKDSYSSAIASLQEEVEKNGVLKILGILN